MRILWFVNSCLPDVQEHLNLGPVGYGWWIAALAEQLIKEDDLSLAVAWFSPSCKEESVFRKNKIQYYCFPYKPELEKLADRLKNPSLARSLYRAGIQGMAKSTKRELRRCLSIVEDFDPDIIHVQGTEKFYGQIAASTEIPIVVSIQGLISAVKDEFWGEVPPLRRATFLSEYYLWRQMSLDAPREREIIRNNRSFIGRTDWDRAEILSINPEATYYSCHEVMRDGFYAAEWSYANIEKWTVFAMAKPYPFKGVHCLLKAVALLKQRFPQIQLRIGGPISNSGYGKYLQSRATALGISELVHFLGHLDEKRIIDELVRANVFVLPSYLENSSNSLVEAQLVGVPSIASGVGGLPSLIDKNRNGLLFSKGNARELSDSIERLFNDRTLAIQLGHQARKDSQKRNNPDAIRDAQLQIYRDVVRRDRQDI